MTYTEEALQGLASAYRDVSPTYDELMLLFAHHRFVQPDAREYAMQGLMRRVGLLKRSIENVFRIIPPETTRKPSKERRHDAELNIQSFVANVFGALDNMAWIIVKERNIPYRNRLKVYLTSDLLDGHVSAEFSAFVRELQPWYQTMVEFRHALVHRIPLYIAPYVVPPRNRVAYGNLERMKVERVRAGDFEGYDRLDARQNALGKFRAMMSHSFTEGSPQVYFHAQMLQDWVNITHLATLLRKQLEARPPIEP